MHADWEKWPVINSGVGARELVFLHGFLGDKADWNAVIQALSEEYLCRAYDLPGHGGNKMDAIPMHQLLLPMLRKNIHAVCRPPVHLVGYSMGGRIVLNYGVLYPEDVASLTLVSASPGIRDTEARQLRVDADQSWADMARKLSPREFLKSWYEQPVFESLRSRTDLKDRTIQRRAGASFRLIPNVLEKWGQGVVPALWSRLSDLKIPLHVVVGKEDTAYVSHADHMKRLNPSIHVSKVESAGHTVHLEQPEKLAMIIDYFLTSIGKKI